MVLKEAKIEFLNIKTVDDFIRFKENYSNVEWDKEMCVFFQDFALELANGETIENHYDPREAFQKREHK